MLPGCKTPNNQLNYINSQFLYILSRLKKKNLNPFSVFDSLFQVEGLQKRCTVLDEELSKAKNKYSTAMRDVSVVLVEDMWWIFLYLS